MSRIVNSSLRAAIVLKVVVVSEYQIKLTVKPKVEGHLGGKAVERLLSAQGVILEFWDRVPPQAPCMEPASLFACVFACLCVSHEQISKIFEKKEREKFKYSVYNLSILSDTSFPKI